MSDNRDQVSETLLDALRGDDELLRRFVKTFASQQNAPQARAPTYTILPTSEEISEQTTTSKERKPLAWPKWSGKAAEFPLYINRLIFKYNIDGPLGFCGDKRSVWYSILETLPDDKKYKVEAFWITGGPKGTYDPQQFFNHLDITFGNPREKEEAQEKLQKFRMDDGQHWSEFWLSYDSLSQKAGLYTWTDESKIVFLEHRLSPALRDALWSTPLPVEYNAYVSQVGLLSSKFERTSQFANLRSQRGKKQPQPNRHNDVTSTFVHNSSQHGKQGKESSGEDSKSNAIPSLDQDIYHDTDGDVIMSFTRGTRGGRSGRSRGRGRGGGSAQGRQSEKSNRRAKWVTSDEYAARQTSGRCLRCGSSDGHFIRDCPYLPAVNPNQRSNAAPGIVVSSTQFKPLLDDEDVFDEATEEEKE